MTSTVCLPGAGSLLAAAEAAVGALCDATDPAVLLGSDALGGLARLTVVARQVAALQSALAVRVVESNTWRGRGSATGELWLAKQLGCTGGAAHRLLATGRKLDDLPATREAFASGTISSDEADAIVAAAVVDPGAESGLLAIAVKDHDLAVTRKAADKVRHQSRSAAQEQARRARIRRARRWNEFTDRDDGAAGVSATFVPAEFTIAKVVLDAFERRVFTAARLAGTRDTSAAYRADAFLAAMAAAGATIGIATSSGPATVDQGSAPPLDEQASTAAGRSDEPFSAAAVAAAVDVDAGAAGRTDEPFPIDGSVARATSDPGPDTGLPVPPGPGAVTDSSVPPGPPGRPSLSLPPRAVGPPGLPGDVKYTVIVLVDAIALRRGYAAPGETCCIEGVGDVSVTWANQIVGAGFFELLVHDGVDIVTYASSTRHRPRPVAIAVKTRDRTCIVPGCRRVQRVEYDHRTNFSETKRTDYKALGLLCQHHHDEKTHRGARLERHDNEWWWYPPPDTHTAPDPATCNPDAAASTTGDPNTLPDHDPNAAAGKAGDTTFNPNGPWRAPVGEHLTHWNLDHLPNPVADGSADQGDQGSSDCGDPGCDDPEPPTLFGDIC